MNLAKLIAAFSQMIAKPGNQPLWHYAKKGHGHGSAGYADGGAFGKCRFGARRSMRRAQAIAEGKYVRR